MKARKCNKLLIKEMSTVAKLHNYICQYELWTQCFHVMYHEGDSMWDHEEKV